MKRSILLTGGAVLAVAAGVGGTLLFQQLDFGPSPERAGQAHIDALHEVAPAGTTIDDSQVLTGARRACEAGPFGSLELMQQLQGVNFTQENVTEQVMPVFAQYCDAIGLPVTLQGGYGT